MKKKFTMLFAALLACVGVMKADVTDLPQITTDLENPIYYTIMNTRSSQPGGLMYWAGDNVGMKDEQTVVLEDKHKFFFTGSHEAMYVHNAATGKKLATIGNGDKAAGSWTDEGTQWAVGVSPMGGGLAFGPKGGLNGNSCWNECNYKTAADKPDFTTWSANDAGSIFIVDLAADYVFPVSNLFYVIEAPLFEKTQGVKKAIYVNNEGKAVWGTEDLTNNNFYWIPTVNAETGEVALKNFGTNTYLSKADGTMTEGIANATLKILGDCSFNINIGGTIHAADHGEGKGSGSNLTGWAGGIGSASAWRFVQKSDPTALAKVVVKYSFTYGGVEKYTQTTNTLVGEEWPAFTVAFPFGVSATKPAGEVSAEGAVEGVVTKVIELSVNLPFTYAADYASITKWYYIQMHSSPGYSKYLQAADDFIEWADAAVDANNKDSYTWAFIGNPFDGLMLVNASTGETKAVNADAKANPVVVPALGAIATGTKWAIKASATNKDAEHFCLQYPGSNQYMNAQSGKVAFYGSADQGSTMWVTERGIDFTYSFVFGGKERHTQSCEALVGADYPEVDNTLLHFGATATKPEGKVTADIADTKVEVQIQTELPFVAAADANSINNWYFIQMHSNVKETKYIHDVTDYISFSNAKVNGDQLNAHIWGFVGNPYDGFKLVNYGAGLDKAVCFDGENDPKLGDIATATQWEITSSDAVSNDATRFCFKHEGEFMNANAGKQKISSWTYADAGSTMWVTEYDITGATDLAELTALVEAENAKEYVAGGIGFYPEASVTALEAALETANNVLADDEKTIATVFKAKQALEAAVAEMNITLPTAGKFYRIKNNNETGYLSSGESGRAQFAEGIGELASSIFYYDGSKLLSYANGMYLGLDGNFVGYTSTVGAEAGTTFAFTASPVVGKLLISFKDATRSFYSAGVGNSDAAGAGQTGDGYRFTVEEVTWLPVAMNATVGFATIYSPVQLELSSGRVKAYTATREDNVLTLVEQTVVPANTGVILELQEGKEGDVQNGYVFLQIQDATVKIADNALVGSFAKSAKNAEANVYTLQKPAEKEVGFYLFKGYTDEDDQEGTKTYINGFRAWVEVAKGVEAPAMFTLGRGGDDEPTGIDQLINTNGELVIYDLSGRRVEKMEKGIYIVNGKKVVK